MDEDWQPGQAEGTRSAEFERDTAAKSRPESKKSMMLSSDVLLTSSLGTEIRPEHAMLATSASHRDRSDGRDGSPVMINPYSQSVSSRSLRPPHRSPFHVG